MPHKILLIFTFLLLIGGRSFSQNKNSIGMEMVEIPAGSFYMGSQGFGEDYDESPAHEVIISHAFKMSATEITNAQYERFDPSHKKWRNKENGFSSNDDDPVVFVNYHDALAFCKWLSKKKGKTYRLPTEAEWEYACRAGTLTTFFTGNDLPKEYQKKQQTTWVPEKVSLAVGKTPSNEWGLYDMSGNVEEWCYDWYGPYDENAQTDPVGRISGIFRVTRGGSVETPVRYLRSANRAAMIPQDKSWLVGFRVVQAELPDTKPLPAPLLPLNMQHVKQQKYHWANINKPVFNTPIPYVHKPGCETKVPFYEHNHCPAITWCPNGDLLAIWFSTNDEAGREMEILGSRLRVGKKQWDEPSLFFKVPDRNMTGSSLFCDQKTGEIFYMNGVEAAGSWQNLAMVLRISHDNGASWSSPVLADSNHTKGNQVIAGMFKSSQGWLIQVADATPGGAGGSLLHISKDGGKAWERTNPDTLTPSFEAGDSGGLIAGIHAGVVQLKNGNLLAFGRGNNIDGHMPESISADIGNSWKYDPSELPPIGGGQRLVLYRLNEGPLLLISFTNHPSETDTAKRGMLFKDSSGHYYKGYGLFAAISFDEGKTWPVKKLITDGKMRYLYGQGWTGAFQMDKTHAEPMGYMALTQSPDNMIHLISSGIYYSFNLKWLMKPVNYFIK